MEKLINRNETMTRQQITRRSLLQTALAVPCMAQPTGTITLESLLNEMVKRDALARFPQTNYRSAQFSSYDRKSVAPGEPGWYANHDWSQFIRSEVHAGRTEWVMMDAEGPGAITRFWMGAPIKTRGPSGTIRIYLDGADSPVISEEADRLLSGGAFVTAPLSAVRSIGRNLYLPIPYARRCKVTYDRPNYWESKRPEDRAWYVIESRTYPKDIRVESFTVSDLQRVAATLDRVQRVLTNGDRTAAGQRTDAVVRKLLPGERMQTSIKGPGAIRALTVRIQAQKMAQALRSTVVTMEFDGESTVWCPLGDFFGSGVGLNPYRDWWRRVDASGEMVCFWVMPYREGCRIGLHNLGGQTVEATLGPIVQSAWRWDEASMHFHANWRQQYPLETKKQDGIDWNYIEIRGKGVYVGDTLAIHNGSSEWWGEGDEKIFVDGERFPSHFGTGTEDYYGYSFGDAGVVFEAPFHAQPRAEGNNAPGHTTNTRTRSLDAIPFERSLKLDMEVWHWAQTTMAYAATTYWYARPGASCNRPPAPEEAARGVLS